MFIITTGMITIAVGGTGTITIGVIGTITIETTGAIDTKTVVVSVSPSTDWGRRRSVCVRMEACEEENGFTPFTNHPHL